MSIVTKRGMEYETTPYEEVIEAIMGYIYLAQDSHEKENASVHVYPAETGGFEVSAWPVPVIAPYTNNEEQYIGLDGIYVTVDDARRLIEGNLAAYGGRIGSTFESAVATMEDNALPHDENEYIMADGEWQKFWSYDQAVAYIREYRAALPNNNVCLMPYSSGYEIVSDIAEDATGRMRGIAGVYVRDADAARLAGEEGALLYELE